MNFPSKSHLLLRTLLLLLGILVVAAVVSEAALPHLALSPTNARSNGTSSPTSYSQQLPNPHFQPEIHAFVFREEGQDAYDLPQLCRNLKVVPLIIRTVFRQEYIAFYSDSPSHLAACKTAAEQVLDRAPPEATQCFDPSFSFRTNIGVNSLCPLYYGSFCQAGQFCQHPTGTQPCDAESSRCPPLPPFDAVSYDEPAKHVIEKVQTMNRHHSQTDNYPDGWVDYQELAMSLAHGNWPQRFERCEMVQVQSEAKAGSSSIPLTLEHSYPSTVEGNVRISMIPTKGKCDTRWLTDLYVQIRDNFNRNKAPDQMVLDKIWYNSKSVKAYNSCYSNLKGHTTQNCRGFVPGCRLLCQDQQKCRGHQDCGSGYCDPIERLCRSNAVSFSTILILSWLFVALAAFI